MVGVVRDDGEQRPSRYSTIDYVRGMGLMLGVELVKDRVTKEPAKLETAEALECCKKRDVLIGKGGLYGNVLRIKPPMCISKDDADYLAVVLDEVLTEIGNTKMSA